MKLIIFILMLALFAIWLIISFFSFVDESSAVEPACNGNECQRDICDAMHNNLISGNLCMDLCVDKKLLLAGCSDSKFDSNPFYNYYSVGLVESTFICPRFDKNLKLIKENSELSDLVSLFSKKIEQYLHHPPTVEAIIQNLLSYGDVNHNGKIELAEANNLWIFLNNRPTLYSFILTGKSYVLEIKNFCGGFIETEQILNRIDIKKESYLQSVFPINFNWFWPDWNYRCKISIGILEFFMDAISINPNDEFGMDSLYLCSPIESSFASTFVNEAKLINYEEILNGRSLREKLMDRNCYSDADCIYTTQCQTKCDLKTNTCTSDLVRPQIVYYCRFLKEYLFDNENATAILKPIVEKCENLKPFTKSNKVMYHRNEMPLSYEKHKIFVAQLNYWNSSMDYAIVTNKLLTSLWEFVKLTKDPQRAKKKTTKLPEHPDHHSHPKK